jgi:hypothetical protein
MSRKRLYEFTQELRCAVVVYASSKKKALQALDTWERAWVDTGEILGCTGTPDLVQIREGTAQEAHITAP